MKYLACLLLLSATPIISFAQEAYRAPWISYPTASVTTYGVYHFRKAIIIDKIPDKLVVHVSADNRYNLFVNGRRVCYGPAKGDLKTYKYDFIDIAPFLVKGKNQLAALVYNAGQNRPDAIISAQTAFFLKSEDPAFAECDTDDSWLVYMNPAYSPISYYEMLFKDRWFYGYYACGPGDDVNAGAYPWGWEKSDFDDSQWARAEVLRFDGPAPWNLVPRNIPFMDNHPVYPKSIRLAEGTNIPEGFLNRKNTWTIPANSEAKILIDYGVLTMGYPELKVNGGNGGTIQVKYAEALYDTFNLKAHRDSVTNKIMYGVWDVFRPDGEERVFRPLWKRCFRYVQLIIKTDAYPLTVISHTTEYSGYPYHEMAIFDSNDQALDSIFAHCLRTLQMCSGETYYDTPFYEQLSYGGDNRPIGLNSVYNSTDDRLFREVMRLYPQSENKETGLLHSAYPSSRLYWDNGTWSLAWIQSLHDYYFLRGDKSYVAQFTGNMERILRFFQQHMNEATGMLGPMNAMNFIDWSITKGRLPRTDAQGTIDKSAIMTLWFAHTLDCAVKLYEQIGEREKASSWAALSAEIKKSVKTQCWDTDRQLFRDSPDQQIYSQHTNIFAILCDVLTEEEQKALMQRILTYDRFDEMASSYFSFYLFMAMDKTGMQDEFLNHLGFWHNFLERGHTTAGETGFASHDRSDCHAWAAHPSYYLLSMVCGIKPADTGFQTVRIVPHLGNLKSVEASMPHPAGRIMVSYKMKKDKLTGTVILPAGLSGEGTFNGKTMLLRPGENVIGK